MRRNHLLAFGLIVLVGVSMPSISKADDVDELIDLLQIREEMKNQYDDCIESSKRLAEEDFGNSIKENFEGIPLDSQDLAILNTIYSNFWGYGCDFVKSEEVVNFYKAEFRKGFTSKEIRELITFYETPLGNKISGQWLEMNQKFARILADRQFTVTQESQKMFEADMERFFKHLEKRANEESSAGA